MPKRHVVEPLIPSDEVLLRNGKHIFSRIALFLSELNSEEERAAKQFFISWVPDGYSLKPGENKFLTGLGYAVVALQAYFYRPGIPCTERRRFDAPCDYEVLIPFRSIYGNAIRYWIVPTGTQPGDTVTFLNPPPITYRSDLLSERLHAPLESGENGKSTFENCRQIIKNYRSIIEQDERVIPTIAGFRYGTIQVPAEPVIRLPCYNVPLQCAYELVNKAIGDLIGLSDNVDNSIAYFQAALNGAQNQAAKLRPKKSKPLDPTLFSAFFSWFGWELKDKDLSPDERLDLLCESMKAVGAKSQYGTSGKTSQAQTLKKRCNEIFKTQMSGRKERLRVKSKSGNYILYVIREKKGA